jgi:hypothetical protein
MGISGGIFKQCNGHSGSTRSGEFYCGWGTTDFSKRTMLYGDILVVLNRCVPNLYYKYYIKLNINILEMENNKSVL